MKSRGGGAWSSSRRRLRHGGRELGAGKVAVRHGRGLTTFHRARHGGRQLIEGREVAAGEVLFNYQRLLEMGRGYEGGVLIRWGKRRGFDGASVP
jgi:hypothetical protein